MLSLEQVAGRCDKVRWQGKDTFLACCVGHDDRTPSMAVSDVNGKLLFHCFAGCSQDVLLDALGMTGNRDYRPLPTKPPPRPEVAKPTADYARKIWQATRPDEPISWDKEVAAHPYAIKKEMNHAWGATRGYVSGRLIGKNADCLILSMKSLQGELVGVECINADGVKQTFGSKGVLILGNTLDKELPIYITEGWADAVATMRYYGDVVAMAVFGKGKQDSTAQYLHSLRPDREIILMRDAS